MGNLGQQGSLAENFYYLGYGVDQGKTRDLIGGYPAPPLVRRQRECRGGCCLFLARKVL